VITLSLLEGFDSLLVMRVDRIEEETKGEIGDGGGVYLVRLYNYTILHV
jgi:hypothetical protein